jgi:multicomponent Na+:H+ antiporter subunit G
MIALAFLSLGSVFLAIGTLGVLRFRDIYSRLQASGVADNAGTAFVLVGLIAYHGLEPRDWTLAVLLILLLVTSPIATHSIAKSAFTQGVETGDPL